MNEKTGKILTAMVLVIWIALQIYTSFDIAAHSFCTVYFPGKTLVLTGLWLLCLLALDTLLYFFGGRRLFRNLKWYWGACALLIAALFLFKGPPVLTALAFGITPYLQMLLASFQLFEKGAGASSDGVTFILTLLMVLGHFLWMFWLQRRLTEPESRKADS